MSSSLDHTSAAEPRATSHVHLEYAYGSRTPELLRPLRAEPVGRKLPNDQNIVQHLSGPEQFPLLSRRKLRDIFGKHSTLCFVYPDVHLCNMIRFSSLLSSSRSAYTLKKQTRFGRSNVRDLRHARSPL